MTRASLRRQLMLGILLPVLAVVGVNSASLYGQALRAADTAYDRTLLASAKAIGELLEIDGNGGTPLLRANVPYSALEAFEADNRSRMYYRVTGFDGEMVSGFPDLPPWRGTVPVKGPYAALVDFYDDAYRGEPVRVAVLLQPVAGVDGIGVATIQVAETLELRHTLARQLLIDTLWRQAALLALIAVVVVIVVQRATRPVRRISAHLRTRAEGDLSPIDAGDAPRELLPLVDATNQVMARLAHLLEHQKRFVRDASHQLRTPLAVLKAQVQSALRGDVPPADAMREVAGTVDRATRLANQMLALAKVEQVQAQPPVDVALADVVGEVALDLAPLIAAKSLDFELQATPLAVRGHDWMLRELTRNLLSNALRETPAGGRLLVVVARDGDGRPLLRVCDDGPGLPAGAEAALFEPFHTGHPTEGSGLGLAICRSICDALGARLELSNRLDRGRIAGVDAEVTFQ